MANKVNRWPGAITAPAALGRFVYYYQSWASLRYLARWVLRVGLFVALVAFWEWLVDSGVVHEVILPPPSAIWSALKDITTSSFFLLDHLFTTLGETGAGFGIGVGIGLFLAILLTTVPLMRPLFTDYIVAFEAIPKVTLIPILIAWFGFGMQSKIVLAALISFFPVFLTATAGMSTVSEDWLRLMGSLRADRFQRLLMVQLPNALPPIFGGLKIALTNSLIGAIITEFFGARVGLGYLITIYNIQIRPAYVFALLLMLTVIAVLLFYLLDVIARRVCFWARSGGEAPSF